MTPKKRERNLNLTKTLSVGLTVPYDVTIRVPSISDNYTESMYDEKQHQVKKSISKIKFRLYREFSRRFKKTKLNYYWCNIRIMYSDEGFQSHNVNIINVRYDFHYLITFKFSQHDLNRLKLVDQYLYDAMIDKSGESPQFMDMFGYILQN